MRSLDAEGEPHGCAGGLGHRQAAGSLIENDSTDVKRRKSHTTTGRGYRLIRRCGVPLLHHELSHVGQCERPLSAGTPHSALEWLSDKSPPCHSPGTRHRGGSARGERSRGRHGGHESRHVVRVGFRDSGPRCSAGVSARQPGVARFPACLGAVKPYLEIVPPRHSPADQCSGRSSLGFLRIYLSSCRV
jgi:hypothetical protein